MHNLQTSPTSPNPSPLLMGCDSHELESKIISLLDAIDVVGGEIMSSTDGVQSCAPSRLNHLAGVIPNLSNLAQILIKSNFTNDFPFTQGTPVLMGNKSDVQELGSAYFGKQPTMKSLVTDCINLSLRTVASLRSVDNADNEKDAEVLQAMGLSFAVELHAKLCEIEKLVYPGVNKHE